MKTRQGRTAGFMVLAVLLLGVLYEYQPAHYQALLCIDKQAEPSGQWNSAYDGYFIGANGCVYRPDTALEKLPPLVLEGTNRKAEPLWYVNGANLRIDWVQAHMYRLALSSGRPVLAIYNATLGGRFLDAINDAIRGSRATEGIERVILESLARGGEVYFQVNSQGAIHMARALRRVVTMLSAEQLQKVHVLTAGAASADFPDGPDYIHLANEKDPVPLNVGVLSAGAHVGAGAKVIRFAGVDSDPLEMRFRFFGPLTHAFLSVHGLMVYQPYFPAAFKAEKSLVN